MKFEIIEARPYHCGQILRHLRPEHARAISGTGMEAHRTLRAMFDQSWYRKAWMVDGRLLGIGGVSGTPLSSEGLIWSVFSEEAERYPFELVRTARSQIAHVMMTNHRLLATVLNTDLRAYRFAQFLGFLPEKIVPLGNAKVIVMNYAEAA